jgi:glycosyltransferase involved in cell wall biosynthesis
MSQDQRSFNLSVVLPVHDEQAILEQSVLALERHLSTIALLDRFEILLVCNGCLDDSEGISRRLAERMPDRIKALSLRDRGLGRAIRAGIGAAAHEAVMFYAVDLPFGLTVLDGSIAAARENRNRIVIGSKAHRESRVARGLSRRAFSSVVSFLNNWLFALDVKDTQGSVLFPRAVFERYHAAMDSPGAFFQAQIILYGRLLGCELLEIPVRLAESGGSRPTRFVPIRDGAAYIAALVRERVKINAARSDLMRDARS